MNGLLRFAGSDDQDQRQMSEERAEQYESPIKVTQSVPAVILSQDKIRFGPNCQSLSNKDTAPQTTDNQQQRQPVVQ